MVILVSILKDILIYKTKLILLICIYKLKLKISESNYQIDNLNEKIKAGGYSVDMTTFEGTVFERLKTELIENKKLNYKYGRQ